MLPGFGLLICSVADCWTWLVVVGLCCCCGECFVWLIWIVLLLRCYCCIVRLIWVLLRFGLLNIQVCVVDLFAVLLLCIDCLFTFAGWV